MADVLPLRALHYDLSVVGSLADVVAPPYDVIDAAQRAELVGRSPYNVAAVDLPEEDRGDDRYDAAGELFETWQLQRSASCATASRRCGRTRSATPAPMGRR